MKTGVLAAIGGAVILAAGGLYFVMQGGAGPGAKPGAPAPMAAPTAMKAPAPVAAAAPVVCIYPGPPPVVPHADVASADDMKLAHNALQAFVLQLEAFQKCRDDQADHAPASVSQTQKEAWINEGDTAIDEANKLKELFGEQVKIFNARQPQAK